MEDSVEGEGRKKGKAGEDGVTEGEVGGRRLREKRLVQGDDVKVMRVGGRRLRA